MLKLLRNRLEVLESEKAEKARIEEAKENARVAAYKVLKAEFFEFILPLKDIGEKFIWENTSDILFFKFVWSDHCEALETYPLCMAHAHTPKFGINWEKVPYDTSVDTYRSGVKCGFTVVVPAKYKDVVGEINDGYYTYHFPQISTVFPHGQLLDEHRSTFSRQGNYLKMKSPVIDFDDKDKVWSWWSGDLSILRTKLGIDYKFGELSQNYNELERDEKERGSKRARETPGDQEGTGSGD